MEKKIHSSEWQAWRVGESPRDLADFAHDEILKDWDGETSRERMANWIVQVFEELSA